MAEKTGIPRDIVQRICEHIREENKNDISSRQAMQCRGCEAFRRGNATRMCTGHGCSMVIARYRQLTAQQV